MFFIKLGLAKDQKQANRRMFGLAIICLLLTVYINVSTFAPEFFQFGQNKTLSTIPNKFQNQTQQGLSNQ